MASPPLRLEDSPSSVTRHVEFEASIFSALESNITGPLSLNLPRSDAKHAHETRRTRYDSKASHRSSLHRSSSLVFHTLPPLRRIPSLQVPSLTDITNPHTLSTPTRRSLHQISETEATTYKLKLPLRLVHPNSPYVPWEAPFRRENLRPASGSHQEESADRVDYSLPISEDKLNRGDMKPIKHIWTALKSAPRSLKTKCQRLLNPRVKDQGVSSLPPTVESESPLHGEEELVTYGLDPSSGCPYSPTSSFRSADTNTLAIWLAERQRIVFEKDCESAKMMTIEDYERVGSWVKPGDHGPFSSRSSYHCSFVDGDTVSSVLILESDCDLTASATDSHPLPRIRSTSVLSSRPAFGPKRAGEEEKLSRIVHRSSLRSYFAERSLSVPGP